MAARNKANGRNGGFSAVLPLLLLFAVLSTACSGKRPQTNIRAAEPVPIAVAPPQAGADSPVPKPLPASPVPTPAPTAVLATPRPKSAQGRVPGRPVQPMLAAADASVSLVWLREKTAAYYEIFTSQDNIDYRYLDETADTVYLARGLDPNTAYFYKVRAVSENDREGDFSEPAGITTEPPLKAPGGEAGTDLLLLATHMDDELVFFGGILPYYTKQLNKTTALVFSCDNGKPRREHERKSLNTLGLTELEPEFLGFLGSFRIAEEKTWQQEPDDALVLELVRCIRRHRPAVVVSHDTKGEYHHAQHVLTTFVLCRALQKCANPGFDAESAEEYGAWMPRKVYLHLYSKNEVKLDYEQPLPCYDGKTALHMARQAVKHHPHAGGWRRIPYTGEDFDSSRFGLYYSSVGLDQNADLFDNL